MQLFVMSSHCKSKMHCMTCRNKESGRAWREDLKKDHQLPDNNVDFECPYGVPWNFATGLQDKLQNKVNEINAQKILATQPTEPQKVESKTVPATKFRDGGSRGCGCGGRRG